MDQLKVAFANDLEVQKERLETRAREEHEAHELVRKRFFSHLSEVELIMGCARTLKKGDAAHSPSLEWVPLLDGALGENVKISKEADSEPTLIQIEVKTSDKLAMLQLGLANREANSRERKNMIQLDHVINHRGRVPSPQGAYDQAYRTCLENEATKARNGTDHSDEHAELISEGGNRPSNKMAIEAGKKAKTEAEKEIEKLDRELRDVQSELSRSLRIKSCCFLDADGVVKGPEDATCVHTCLELPEGDALTLLREAKCRQEEPTKMVLDLVTYLEANLEADPNIFGQLEAFCYPWALPTESRGLDTPSEATWILGCLLSMLISKGESPFQNYPGYTFGSTLTDGLDAGDLAPRSLPEADLIVKVCFTKRPQLETVRQHLDEVVHMAKSAMSLRATSTSEASALPPASNPAIISSVGRMTQAEEMPQSIALDTPWHEIKPARGCAEELRTNHGVRKVVPKIDKVLDDGLDQLRHLRNYSTPEVKELVSKLDDDELLSAILYSHDLMQPNAAREGNLYFECNNGLRVCDEQARKIMMNTWGVYVHYALRGLSKLPNVEGVLLRALPCGDEVAAEYKEGREIKWKAFTSSTTSLNAAKMFLTDSTSGLIFRIKAKNGKAITSLSFFPQEGEVLLWPGQKYIVTREAYEEDGFTFIDLLEVTSTFIF